jgi:hypothetical protein
VPVHGDRPLKTGLLRHSPAATRGEIALSTRNLRTQP